MAGQRGPVAEVTWLFLKLGSTAFGGPAAHVAMFEEEVVERRGWLDRQRFLDLLGATQLIPGPNSTEMAIHVGLVRAGWRGLIAAGVAFVLPAVVLSTVAAWAYVRFGELPRFDPILAGIKPVVLAILVGALWRLGRSAVRGPGHAALAIGAAAAALAGLGPVAVLVGGGIVGAVLLDRLTRNSGGAVAALVVPARFGAVAAASAAVVEIGRVTLGALALAFLQVGAFLYGSGYVLVAFLQESLVQNRGWLTEQQLLDAIAIGQFTPGPVLSTAAFVGYVVAGVGGAAVASTAIFLPSFLYVAMLSRLIPRLRDNRWSAAFLDAVNACAVALIAVVSLRLGIAALTGLVPLMIFALAAVARTAGSVNPMLLVLAGGLVGWFVL